MLLQNFVDDGDYIRNVDGSALVHISILEDALEVDLGVRAEDMVDGHDDIGNIDTLVHVDVAHLVLVVEARRWRWC